MNEPNAIVPAALMRRLNTYLERLPFREVAPLLAALSQCPPEPAPTTEAPSE